MLLFRGTHWNNLLSPEEIQEVMSRWTAWFDRLSQQGKAKAGQPLRNEGAIVSGKKGVSVADGPFVESKEAVNSSLTTRKKPTMPEATAIEWIDVLSAQSSSS